ncbi:MAG: PIG-L family deacetylase [Candidatus Aenigmarchaeota archaeon]|nr:PIG-L family deacetylase [Candidatus Aenigmarchaeota archaeon]
MEEIDLKNKIIMVIGAHPDDNDFGVAATVSKASKLGSKVIYVVATKGNRGTHDESMNEEKLAEMREKEQRDAGRILGISEFEFLGYNDGELTVNMELKEKITRLIRKHKPGIVFTTDPSKFYYKDRGFINHSDHRAIGEAVIDAVYPLARDFLFFPQHAKEGLKWFHVKEICFSSFDPADINSFVDVSDAINLKVKALEAHISQISNIDRLKQRMLERAEAIGKAAGCKYAEGFVRIKLPP